MHGQNAGMIQPAKGVCPTCAHGLVAKDLGLPWCPSCEWNLGAYDSSMEPPLGWRAFTRWQHARAYRLDQELEEEMHSGGGLGARTRAVPLLAGLSALVVVVDLALAGAGVWLIFLGPGGSAPLLGVLAVLVAFLFRPRFGKRPPKSGRLSRDQLPDLWAVVDEIAAAVGTEPVDVISLDHELNASVRRYGIRRRRHLTIGIPLWLVLEPEMRVWLLAHEFGHFVNDDPRRSALVEPALSTVSGLVKITGGDRTLGQILHSLEDSGPAGIVLVVPQLALWIIGRPLLFLQMALLAIALRDHQRAEYAADLAAARIAGRDASVAALDCLLIMDDVVSVVGYGAEQWQPLEWSGRVSDFQASIGTDIEVRRQASFRATGLWASHPPEGRRARLIARQEAILPTLQIDPRRWSRIDAGLRNWYDAVHQSILGTREFRPAGDAT